MKRIIRLVSIICMLALCLSMVLTGCSGNTQNNENTNSTVSDGNQTEETKDAYRFAMVAPLTGNGAQYGLAYKDTIEIMVEQINADGGIDGHMVEVDYFDDKQDPKECLNIANKIVADGDYLAVIGSQTSSCSMAAAPVLQKAGIPMISPNASHVDFPLIGDYIFSMAMPLSYEIVKTTDFLYDYNNLRKIAMIYSNDDWGLQVSEVCRERFTELGGEVVAEETYIAGQTKDFTPLISKIKATEPDAVFLISQYSDGAAIVQQMNQLDFNTKIVAMNTLYKQEFIDIVGEELANGIVMQNSFSIIDTAPEYDVIKEAYESKTGKVMDLYVTHSHDAFAIVLDAVTEVGADKEAIRDYIAGIKNYAGLSGTFSMDANGSVRKNLYALEIKDGTFVELEDFVAEADIDVG